MRFLSVAVLAVVGAAAPLSSAAHAHEGDHEVMPHQVTAGLIPLYITAYDGSLPGLTAGPIDELNAAAIGLTISYGYTFWQLLELRVRAEYIKPFPDRDALRDGLHEFRGVVGVSGVIPLHGQQIQLALGPEAGIAGWRLTEIEDTSAAFESTHEVGYTLSFNTSLRAWVTYHTGFWLELGFGVADAPSIASRWPLRLALGWADRF